MPAMIEEAIERLAYLCNTIPSVLLCITEEAFAQKTGPDRWSKKQILGHLVDSASINHHRFVRPQFEHKPHISYDQNNWNEANFYHHISCRQIINFWESYNRQLVELAKNIPQELLQRKCVIGDEELTIGFLFNDYLVHLEHHLEQIVSY